MTKEQIESVGKRCICVGNPGMIVHTDPRCPNGLTPGIPKSEDCDIMRQQICDESRATRQTDTKIPPQPMIEREAQKPETAAAARQGETPERSGRNDPREIPGFPRPGLSSSLSADQLLAHVRIAGRPGPSDPGPGVYDVENLHRMANRPPDAALDPVSVIMLDLENRAKAEMERRDAVESRLKAQVDWWAEGVFVAWKREERLKRTIRQLVWICGPVICALFWANVWLGWEYICQVAAWIWGLL
jgi:hypothetical protein